MAEYFECPACRTRVRMPMKKHGNLREKGHVKTMWCWKCGRVKPHRLLK